MTTKPHPSCLAELGRLARRTLTPYLSDETMAHPGFNLFDVRIYNGDVEAKTGLHTDSRPSFDADGNTTQEIMQEPGTDVVIFSIDATMLMWLRKYHKVPHRICCSGKRVRLAGRP
jgi:hypothetical protein